jgi:hydrogenase maturation protease
MNRALVKRIADAVLYEGYILYPYRPSVKNRQRWTFGGLYPEDYCRVHASGDASSNQTECLVHGTAETTFETVVRFLHLTARRVGEFVPPLAEWPRGAEPPFRPVETLRVGEKLYYAWQEAEEREVALGETMLGDLLRQPQIRTFSFSAGRTCEPVPGPGGEVVGILAREQQALAGVVEAAAAEVAEGLFKVRVRVANRTALEDGGQQGRDEALLRTLASTHAILGVRGGEFVSLLDPPACWRDEVAACRNVGTWPVLVGEDGHKDTMLSSPIILYDYPQIAPESPGDFFDGTEIDEMLALRILTLTDEEKRAMALLDERTGALLARTEALGREEMLGLHGTVRTLRPLPGEEAHG